MMDTSTQDMKEAVEESGSKCFRASSADQIDRAMEEYTMANILPTKHDLGSIVPMEAQDYLGIIRTQLEHDTCLATFRGNRRITSDLEYIDILQFDYDDVELSPEEISEKIPCKHWILTSKSDLKNGLRRFHLFAPTVKLYSPEEYKQALSQFIKDHSIPVEHDPKATDPVRFFWRHKDLAICSLGTDRPIYAPIIMPEQTKSARTEANDPPSTNRVSLYATPEEAMRGHSFDLSTDGKRWKSMIFIKNRLRFFGFTEHEILRFIDERARYEHDRGKHFTRDKVHDFVSRN